MIIIIQTSNCLTMGYYYSLLSLSLTGFSVRIVGLKHRTTAIYRSMETKSTTKRGFPTMNCSKLYNYNHGFGTERSDIGL
jgi:hypothetical protein